MPPGNARSAMTEIEPVPTWTTGHPGSHALSHASKAARNRISRSGGEPSPPADACSPLASVSSGGSRARIRSNLVVHSHPRRKYDSTPELRARHRGACCQSRCGWPPSGYRRRACRRLDSNELHARHSCRSATESPHRLSVSLRAEDPWPAAPRLPFLGRGTMYLGAGLGWSSRTGSSRD